MKKNVTKALAVVAAVAMVSMTSVSAFAVDGDGTANTSSSTKVKYTVATSYTWSVPSEITFNSTTNAVTTSGDSGNTQDVCVTKNVIPYGMALKITATGSGDGNAFTIKDTVKNNTLPYAITLGGDSSSLNPGGTVLEVNAGTNKATKSLTFTLTKDSVEKAGTYEGTVTYTAAIVSASSNG